MLLGLVTFSWSATINVPGTYSTISAAAANAVSGDTILVASGTYPNEAIEIYNKSLTIRGTGVTRPIVTLTALPTGLLDGVSGNGIGIHCSTVGMTMNVSLENLILIPSKDDVSATRVNNAITVNSNAAAATDFVMNINMADVVVCPNNGSDQPVSTDGLSFVTLAPPAVPFRRAGIELIGNCNGTFTRVVSTNNRAADFAGPGTRGDGLRLLPDFDGFTYTINEGCVFSYNDRLGIVFNSDGGNYTINGSDTSRVLVISNGYVNTGNGDIASFAGKGLTNTGYVHINNCNVFSRNMTSLLTIFNDANGIPLSVSNCLFSSATANPGYPKDCIFLFDGQDVPAPFENVTILVNDPAAAAIFTTNYTASSPKNLNLSNVIIAGQGATAFNHPEPGTINVSYSNLDTVGTYALASVAVGANAAGVVFGSGVIYADPMFLSASGMLADFCDVDNPAFGAAGPSGLPLAGGADYYGVMPAISSAPPGQNRVFQIKGGIPPYSNWSSSNLAVATIGSIGANTAVVTTVGAGSADITVKDSLSRTAIKATVTVVPTSAPLFKEVESKKYIRFELFN